MESILLRSCRPVLVAAILLSVGFSAFAQSPLVNPSAGARQQGGGSDPRNRRPEGPDNRKYDYGKEIYAVKLACAGCPLADKPLDEATARLYFADESLATNLDGREDDAVRTFLKQMFPMLR